MKIRQTVRRDDCGKEIFLSYDDWGELNSEVWEEDGVYSARIHTPEGVKKVQLTEEDGKRMIEIARESYNTERRETRRHVSLEAMDPGERFFTEDYDPLNELDEGYRKQHLREALNALPQGQRDIVIKVYFLNRKQKDIAEEKGISPAAVSRQLSKAFDNIRGYMEERNR